MSKKMSELEQAEARLSELRAQQADLQAQISEAERALKNPDFSSVQAAVDAISMNQVLHDAAAQALVVLTPMIRAAEAEVDAARRAELEKAAEGVRAEEEAAYQAAIDAMIVLIDRLSALDGVHLQLRRYKVGFRHALPVDLARAAAFTYGRLKATDPVRLGLPPLPTPQERARKEAEYRVTSLQDRVNTLEAIIAEAKANDIYPNEAIKALKEARANVKAAEQAMAALN